jgi:prepilin-type N-terminal cleavage/methylation domain-containing protein
LAQGAELCELNLDLHSFGSAKFFDGSRVEVMKPRISNHKTSALTLLEVLVVIAILAVLAKDFGPTFSNTNIRYFVGLGADESNPRMLVAGDRNIIGGTKLPSRILEITNKLQPTN